MLVMLPGFLAVLGATACQLNVSRSTARLTALDRLQAAGGVFNRFRKLGAPAAQSSKRFLPAAD
jgi:hypothetical protein